MNVLPRFSRTAPVQAVPTANEDAPTVRVPRDLIPDGFRRVVIEALDCGFIVTLEVRADGAELEKQQLGFTNERDLAAWITAGAVRR